MFVFKRPLYLYWYPFPKKVSSKQRHILENNFPFYNKLSSAKKKFFQHRLKEFLTKYEFIGKEIQITDEMEILIGATYIMLTFGMRDYLIGLFSRIIIYPSAYYSSVNKVYHKGEFNPRMKAIVFSWEDFLLGHNVTNDNVNLGLHEFAHALHFYCLKSNQTSALIFQDEFVEVMKYFNEEEKLLALIQKGYFRLYAYSNPFEFLAVILEHFFETPQMFKKQHPELFTSVSRMINIDEKYFG
ncbi:zinc-dependent peptidase [Flavobacterium sp. NG2]|uniref:zinc-dependent peptidase n=1 Tax=Flavobacterium sp. NG2 TaxID=3097547 RepID=UPI002A80912D|nr:zinc-dependent peptidase [Flavobacterium sp. NG2]WPR72720.1 zinc-dependent peptidase [Flavobacterium sp. NG2]